MTLAPLGQNWWQTGLTYLSHTMLKYIWNVKVPENFSGVSWSHHLISDVRYFMLNSWEEIVVCVLGRLRTKLVFWEEIYLTISEKYEHLARTGLLESEKYTSAGFQVMCDIEMLNSDPEKRDCGSFSGRTVGDRKYVQTFWIPILRKEIVAFQE